MSKKISNSAWRRIKAEQRASAATNTPIPVAEQIKKQEPITIIGSSQKNIGNGTCSLVQILRTQLNVNEKPKATEGVGRDALRELLRAEEIDLLVEKLQFAPLDDIAPLQRDRNFKRFLWEKIRIIKDSGRVHEAVRLAKICFEREINYEIDSNNPPTTGNLIYQGHNSPNPQVRIDTAYLAQAAANIGIKLKPDTIYRTAINAREDDCGTDGMQAYAELIEASIQHFPEDEKTTRFLDTALMSLGNPKINTRGREKNILDVSRRLMYGTLIVAEIINRKFHLNDSNGHRGSIPPSKRIDAFMQDLRSVAEELQPDKLTLSSQTIGSRNPKEESFLHLASIFYLIDAALGEYVIEPKTINSSLAVLNKTEMPLDINIATVIKNVIQKSLQDDDIRAGIQERTVDLTTAYLANAGQPNIALDLLLACYDYGFVFDPDTVRDIKTGLSKSTEAPDRTKVLRLDGLLDMSSSVQTFIDRAFEIAQGISEGKTYQEDIIINTAETLVRTRHEDSVFPAGILILTALQNGLLNRENNRTKMTLDDTLRWLASPKLIITGAYTDREDMSNLPFMLANQIIDNGFETSDKLRIDYTIHNLREINQMENAIRLLAKAISIEGIELTERTVEATISVAGKEKKLGNWEVAKDAAFATACSLSLFPVSVEKTRTREEKRTTYDYYTRDQLNAGHPDLALYLALNFYDNGYLLNRRTLERILEDSENIEEVADNRQKLIEILQYEDSRGSFDERTEQRPQRRGGL